MQDEDQGHWRGESLKPRLACVPRALSASCLDRGRLRQVGFREAVCPVHVGAGRHVAHGFVTLAVQGLRKT